MESTGTVDEQGSEFGMISMSAMVPHFREQLVWATPISRGDLSFSHRQTILDLQHYVKLNHLPSHTLCLTTTSRRLIECAGIFTLLIHEPEQT